MSFRVTVSIWNEFQPDIHPEPIHPMKSKSNAPEAIAYQNGKRRMMRNKFLFHSIYHINNLPPRRHIDFRKIAS